MCKLLTQVGLVSLLILLLAWPLPAAAQVSTPAGITRASLVRVYATRTISGDGDK